VTRFLVDAQLPPALARMLSLAGWDAEHVADIGMLAATDAEIIAYATSRDAVIVTKDEDFAVLRRSAAGAVPAVVWIRVGNTSRRALLEWLAPRMDDVVQLLAAGERLIEIR
jgi:predicted nuclease of predicted toxin-antitoxin system